VPGFSNAFVFRSKQPLGGQTKFSHARQVFLAGMDIGLFLAQDMPDRNQQFPCDTAPAVGAGVTTMAWFFLRKRLRYFSYSAFQNGDIPTARQAASTIAQLNSGVPSW